MSDLGNKKIFSKNLRRYMDSKGMNTMDLSKTLDVAYSTVADWVKGNSYPRIDKIEMMANYFNIEKSDLIEDKRNLSEIPGVKVIKEIITVPLLGEIACGEPILCQENYDNLFQWDAELGRPNFMLKARGDSMIDAGINDGDLVFFRETPEVENGKIVAVIIDNEATLKRFYKHDNQIILQPENKAYSPIIIGEEDGLNVRILGEMIGMYTLGSR